MKNEKIISEILNSMAKSRQTAIAIAEENLKRCMQNETYASLEYQKRTLAMEIGVNEANGKNCKNLRQNYDSVVNKQTEVLEKTGYTASDLVPNFNCHICNDTGHVNGKLCSCVEKEYEKRIRKRLELSSVPNFTFKDFDYSVFDKESGERMKKLYVACEKFCDSFPNTNVQNLVFLGNTGTGKTCLISAIANELINRQFTVLYLTAFELSQTLLNYHLADVKNKKGILESITNCDLLVIDDLGTEPIYKNVTLEYLFLIINQRNLEKKHTAISSNLTLGEIIDRYGERIFSRITDKSKSKILSVNCNDLRLRVK